MTHPTIDAGELHEALDNNLVAVLQDPLDYFPTKWSTDEDVLALVGICRKAATFIEAQLARLTECEKLKQGYYGEAAKGWTKYREALAREAVLVMALTEIRSWTADSDPPYRNITDAGLVAHEALANTSPRAEAINAVVEAAKGLRTDSLNDRYAVLYVESFRALIDALSRLAKAEETGNALSAKETEMEFTRDHEALLLTVARILRARIGEFASAWQDDDRAALKDALAPFGPLEGPPINEELRRHR